MHIHEYQAKELLRAYGIPTPQGRLARSHVEALEAARAMPGPVWVVKAQIHAGGRGKGGGVKICRSPEEVGEAAASLLGSRLVTRQTGPSGEAAGSVWIEQGTAIAHEYYLAVALDRAAQCLTVMASPDGGMDIETVAVGTPERVSSARLSGHTLWPFQIRKIVGGWGLDAAQTREAAALVRRLTALAVEKDLTQLEINPLALAEGGGFVALDAKMDFDDSALKRHPDVAALKDREEGDPLERAAAEKGLTYVRLGGSIGTLVNGAGLAMATMDAIKQAGAESANFLDAGGGASEETVAAAFAIMFSDPHVRGVLINIFGGILRCDVVAHGIVNAARKLDVTVPLVVRLEGTNVEAGRRILHESGLQFHTASSMPEAARLIAHLTAETQREVCA
ncbi:MAG: ADP-forming succinate--CoA ligase subunit beta [Bilophila wadsworthia]|uniref:ADP-forming succinate--CoA ligase subunit beta n=1 Tax=Bilophila wadsworthia TaxID=35833 RepID=UPI002670136A|nr:ADP-forming succinate--CoA ligase subunit beta [Bilophila wadsworthia]